MNKKIVWVVVGVIALIAVFYGGVVYGRSQNNSAGMRASQQSFSFNGPNGGTKNARNGNSFGGIMAGEIISKDAQSITISLQSGGSKIILISSGTKVSKMASGNLSDLTTGANVAVTGSLNSDGSINADSIQIRPAMTDTQGKTTQPQQ